MFRSLFMGLWFFGLVAGAGAPVLAEDSPTAVVERLHATLLDNMKNGKALGFEGRRAKLDPVVKEAFDLESMTRISTGAGWQKMPQTDQANVIKAFSDWTVASYAGNFDDFSGETFTTKDTSKEDAKGNVMVNTRLDPKGIPPVLLNYRLHKVNGAWKIFDIYLDGAISQLAMRRAEFSAVLARGTPADLVTHMNKLTEDAKKG